MPSDRWLMNIEFPAGGLDRRIRFQNARPWTTGECANVRSRGTLEGRARGGQRSGLKKAIATELGDGNPVNLLAELPVMGDSGFTSWQDLFQDDTLDPVWTQCSWLDDAPLLMPADKTRPAPYADETGAVRDLIEGMDTSQDYSVSIYVTPYATNSYGARYRIYLRMDDDDPDVTEDGVEIELMTTNTVGGYSGTIVERASGSATVTPILPGDVTGRFDGWLTALVSGNSLKVYLDDELLSTVSLSAAAGDRFGFGTNSALDNSKAALVDMFRVQYYGSSSTRRDVLLAASNGTLYRENVTPFMEAIASDVTLATDKNLLATPRLQNLFIADYSEANVSGTDGTIGGAGNDELTATGVSDWTSYGIDADTDMVELYNCLGGIAGMAGTYAISSVATAKLTIDTDLGGTGGTSYRILRAPKVYDGVANTLSLYEATAGKGHVPVGCPLICLFADSIVMAGSHVTPNEWFFSRKGDPYDWDYSQEDAEAAVHGPSSEAGRIGPPIKALIPHIDDYLVFGCRTQLWVLRGDPRYGGRFDNLSFNVGVVDKGAWCKTPEGFLVFLSHDGLYYLPPMANGTPQSLSREKAPRELRDIDTANYQPLMVYDTRERGIHIYNAMSGANAGGMTKYQHWFFDWEGKSFWPDTLPTDFAPSSVLDRTFLLTGGDPTCIIGCQDGYIRGYDDTKGTDDGETLSSHVQLGPFRVAKDDTYEGILTRLVGTPGAGSGYVGWQLYVGDTAEAVAKSTTRFAAGTWGPGLSHNSSVRARGAWAMLKLNNAQAVPWVIESVRAVARRGGRRRKA